MKKLWSVLLSLVLIFSFAAAQAETSYVCLSYTAILAGENVYFAGEVGGETGLFQMDKTGKVVQKLSDSPDISTLFAASDTSVICQVYDEDNDAAQVVVFNTDGSSVTVDCGWFATPIYRDGRYYWSTYSCAADGSDKTDLFAGKDISDPHEIYPVEVADGQLYYLDRQEKSDVIFYEGSIQPAGAALMRMDLASGEIETVSGLGTRFLGLSDGEIFYSRENFWVFIDEDYNMEEVSVDRGLFRYDPATREETALGYYETGSDEAFLYFSAVVDGVIYGSLSDYSNDFNGEYAVVTVDRTGEMQTFPISREHGGFYPALVQDGVLYACALSQPDPDTYEQDTYVLMIDLATMEETVLPLAESDSLFYSESDIRVAVADERIYLCIYDEVLWQTSMQSLALDGGDRVIFGTFC